MASKEVKNALKAAREAIRNKDFKEALKQCKVALAEDKNNYNALVFVGVAAEGLEQYEQALKAYRRAVETSPEQLLAWQGLSTMYSKNPDQVPKQEMVGVYEKLVELYENDKEKQQDAMAKFIQLTPDTDVEKILALYEKLQSQGSGSRDVLLQLISSLTRQPQLKPDLEAKLLSVMEEFLSLEDAGEGDKDLEKYLQTYLQILQKREPMRLYEETSKLMSRFPSSTFALETKLRLLLDRQMVKPDTPQEVEEIRKLVSAMAQLTEGEKSAALLLAEGYLDLLDGKLASAKSCLQQGISKLRNLFSMHYFLAQALFKLHENLSCLRVCEEGLSVLSSKTRVVTVNTSDCAQKLLLLAAHCCYLHGSRPFLTQALTHLDKLSDHSVEEYILRAYIYLELEDQEQFQLNLKQLDDTQNEVKALKAWADYHCKNYVEASTKLQQCVMEDTTNAQYLLKLGQALWEQRQEGPAMQEQCFNTLLKAAKMDPNLSGTFLFLGHFYAELKKDQQRAKKCYQKAYDLNPNNEEAGAALCDLMADLGEEQNVQSLLQKVTDTASAGCAKWAWLRLGLAQVRTGDLLTATASFQSALRADPSDRHVWECLAEAYLHRGSFTAALKAFAKAAELHPESTYCLYQIANIKQKLGVLQDAADEYRLILDMSADYVPALKGLGETHLLIAQRYLSQYLIGLAGDNCQQAIVYLTRAATQRPDLSCLWKLLGDCCTVLHSTHSQTFRISVPRRLCQTASQDDTDMVEIGLLELLELGTKCYGRALKILPDSGPLWHDLGISFFYVCTEKSSITDQKSLIDKCVHALKKSLSLDPDNHLHWTALGVIAASQYVKNSSLAQHCFIKSIESESNNAPAWTNLGTLYLQQENIELAHEAFKIAQSQDPEYVNSWIGQALIAEIVGSDEAMDLFRHTTQLGIHMESCSGYAHWVVTTLLDVSRQDTEAFQYCIKQMAAVPAACDAITRYTVVMKDDPCAWNMLGLLQEHQDLNTSALGSFQRAAQLAVQTGTDQDAQMKIQLNVARLLSKTQKYSEAAAVYKSNAKGCSFANICQWGLALYKAGRYQDSYEVYQQALPLAAADHDKSDVQAAMGMVAFKAGNTDDAKNALFQGFQLSTPSLQGLFALCALGLLQGDLTLTQATLKELSNLATDSDKLVDVATLTAALKVQQGEASEAMDSTEGMISDNSEVVGLYLLMSRLGLAYNSGYLAESSARIAVSKGTPNDQGALLCLALSQLSVGKHSRRQPADDAIRMAQKAFHCRPDDVSALCCLAGAVHGEAVIQFITKGTTSLLSLEVRLLDLAMTSPKVTTVLKSWCLKQKAVSQILLEDNAGAGLTLKQLLAEFPTESGAVDMLQCIVTGNQSRLEPLVIRDGTELFFWQVLLVGLMKKQCWEEAGVLLREALQKASGESRHVVKVVCLATIAWVAAQQLVQGGGKNSEGALAELEEASQALEQVSDRPYTLMQILQALVHLDSNPRKAKHHFANVLEPGHVGSNLGVEVSLARRGIMSLLSNSSKDTEQELVKKLLSDAEASGDDATVQFYKKLQNL